MTKGINGLYTNFTCMGRVESVSPAQGIFNIALLTGEPLEVRISRTTWYEVIRNVGEDPQDRVPDPENVEQTIGARPQEAHDASMWDAKRSMMKYVNEGRLLCIQGVQSFHNDTSTFDARRVVLMHSTTDGFGWEINHWWPFQINALFEQWLDTLFQDRREITENDFAQFYRTNLDLLGNSTQNAIQECATMSRFLYGLSSSYLLTGNPRALSAARACAAYLINAYSDLRRGGRYCLWKFGRVPDGNSTKQIFASLNPDDRGTYALYEQIYALSGLTQYYRVTQDVWVLSYITRTIEAFQALFLDTTEGHEPGDTCFTGKGGYYSHIDYVTLRPDSPALDATGNRCKKNWNSIGDHIPAYLVNLLVSIDPTPDSSHPDTWTELRTLCRKVLEDCVRNIIGHFKPNDGSAYVQERFTADWASDSTWGWQQDRAIVGHNLKISWNLTRCGHYFATLAADETSGDKQATDAYGKLSQDCYNFARKLGNNMIESGCDLIRGGIFDAVERHPSNGMPIEFAWEATKDFWQQEQAILAYYIMHGLPEEQESEKKPGPTFLELARYCSAFWNLFFVDQDSRKIFFRTTESGMPVIAGQYGIQAGHAIAGYHAFELSYLAHIYIRTYVTGVNDDTDSFTLTFCPARNSSLQSINLLPDFLPPGTIEIATIRVNGLTVDNVDPKSYQFDISSYEPNSVIEVELKRAKAAGATLESAIPMTHLLERTKRRSHRIEFNQKPSTTRLTPEGVPLTHQRPI